MHPTEVQERRRWTPLEFESEWRRRRGLVICTPMRSSQLDSKLSIPRAFNDDGGTLL